MRHTEWKRKAKAVSLTAVAGTDRLERKCHHGQPVVHAALVPLVLVLALVCARAAVQPAGSWVAPAPIHLDCAVATPPSQRAQPTGFAMHFNSNSNNCARNDSLP